MQVLAIVLYYLVFIMLFIALALYLASTVYGYYKSVQAKKEEYHLGKNKANVDK